MCTHLYTTRHSSHTDGPGQTQRDTDKDIDAGERLSSRQGGVAEGEMREGRRGAISVLCASVKGPKNDLI